MELFPVSSETGLSASRQRIKVQFGQDRLALESRMILREMSPWIDTILGFWIRDST